MPHWESAIEGNWANAVHAAGLHYIDPCGEVERVLEDILRSDLLVAEAMHGAIVADALRVPWVPARPLQRAHRWKWHDWASALDLDLGFGRLSASNLLEFALTFAGPNKRGARLLRARGQRLRHLGHDYWRDRAARALVRLAGEQAHLSRDAAIDRAHSRMLEELTRLKRNFAAAAAPVFQRETRSASVAEGCASGADRPLA
jgi:succinoglycan biosynthesis protein ExoV